MNDCICQQDEKNKINMNFPPYICDILNHEVINRRAYFLVREVPIQNGVFSLGRGAQGCEPEDVFKPQENT
jgi:hypothetical protein